jgi:hypothetical protein
VTRFGLHGHTDEGDHGTRYRRERVIEEA